MSGLYGVIGDPIAHSLSPLIHKGWMDEHGLDADYHAIKVADGDLTSALEHLACEGYQGLNITLPHKLAALTGAGSATDHARLIGAANTLIRDDTKWFADNTDAHGFRSGLAHALRGAGLNHASSDTALLIGAGGAAQAVAHVFGADCQNAVFCNRTIDRAEALRLVFDASRADGVSNCGPEVCGLDELSAAMEACHFVVNATSLGHSGRSLDWTPGRGRLVYDLSYGSAADAFLAPARAAGWQTVDGLYMLVAQAARAFEIWFGLEPDMASALARVRAAVEVT